MGASSLGDSLGSYSRSASWTMTTSPVEDHPEAGLCRKRKELLSSSVGGGVVDDEDLLVPDLARAHRVEDGLDGAHFLLSGDDDRDLGHGARNYIKTQAWDWRRRMRERYVRATFSSSRPRQ